MRLGVLFLLLIPALIALGHDFYLFYINHLNPGMFSFDLLKEEFKFSALGFIWTNYNLDSYKSVVQSTDTETWSTIDSILTWKAFYVGLTFAGIMTLLFLILKLFGIGPFSSEEETSFVTGGKKEVSFRAGSSSKKMSYKRK